MNGLRTYLATLLLAFGSALQAADTASPSDEALMLAACQARYTAVLEHAWLMQGDTEAAAMRRDLFAAMLEAALHDAPDQHRIKRHLISFRISQKHAASGLLDTARFGTDLATTLCLRSPGDRTDAAWRVTGRPPAPPKVFISPYFCA